MPALAEWLGLGEKPGNVKACGAYLLGTVTGPSRNRDTVTDRSALTMDADGLTPEAAETLVSMLVDVHGWESIVYTTHKSTGEVPRCRVIISLDRDVTPKEYRRVAKYAMARLSLPDGSWDTKASTSPVQLMLKPSALHPDQAWHEIVEGPPLPVAAALAAVPEDEEVPAVEELSAEALATPPTGPELPMAGAVLDKACREVAQARGTVDKRTGEIPEGRNNACRSWLLPLASFCKAGCLDWADVQECVFAASTEAPGDATWDRREFDRTAEGAWRDAKPLRPAVDPAEEFDPLPPLETEFGEIQEGQFIERGRGGRGLLAAQLASAVTAYLTIAWGEVDQRFYVYRSGVWVPDRRETGVVTSALLGEEFRPSHLTTVQAKLKYTPGGRMIDCGPVPAYINVRNGLVDWRAGELRPHTPDVPSTVQLPVRWDPEAECPEFRKFLAEVLPPDLLEPRDGGPGFIWELLGYLVYSGNPHHIAVLLRGKGRNGKGVLLRVLQLLLGLQNITSVTLHDLVDNRFRSAELFGRIANIAGDLEPKWLKGTATFKGVTGKDEIAGERKYGATFGFTPWAVPIYSANRSFGSDDSSDGYFARWVVVPFPNSFVGREDRGLDARITTSAELEGILRYAVEALPALMARGRLPEPESVKEAKAEFVRSGDQVRAWLEERCVFDPEAWTPRADLYGAYREDAEDLRSLLSPREFYERLGQISDVADKKRQGARGFRGVSIRGAVR